MTDKRYQLRQEDLDYPIYSDLVDIEDNDRVICSFNNDSQINKMVVLLNEQDKMIKELWRENKSYMSDAIKFEKECKRLYNNLRLTNSDLCSEKIMHNHCKKENEQLKQAYQTLKHKHSLLHDVCIEAECDRDSLKKDVISLEKENENLNNVLEDFMVMLNRLQAEPNNKSLQSMAKDMLRMMGKDIMGDSE